VQTTTERIAEQSACKLQPDRGLFHLHVSKWLPVHVVQDAGRLSRSNLIRAVAFLFKVWGLIPIVQVCLLAFVKVYTQLTMSLRDVLALEPSLLQVCLQGLLELYMQGQCVHTETTSSGLESSSR
jgi:hypothetical protein